MATTIYSKDIIKVVNGLEANKRRSEEMSLDIKVAYILKQLGIRPHIRGYHYLKSAIIYVYKDPENLYLITKRLYNMIGRDYETTASCVERAMRHAIETMDCTKDILVKYLGSEKTEYTNKEFISIVAELVAYNS